MQSIRFLCPNQKSGSACSMSEKRWGAAARQDPAFTDKSCHQMNSAMTLPDHSSNHAVPIAHLLSEGVLSKIDRIRPREGHRRHYLQPWPRHDRLCGGKNAPRRGCFDPDMNADILVVGGGTAGAVIAGRLVERTNAQVILLEAGPDPGPRQSGRWPADLLDANRVGMSHDWGYAGPAADGRVLPMSRARVLGGCSSHNACTQSIGWRTDYEHWAKNSSGWNSERLLSLPPDVITRLHIRQPMRADLQPLEEAFLAACIDLGFPNNDDLLDAADHLLHTRASRVQQRIFDGARRVCSRSLQPRCLL
ncbi:MAG: hypothetical protein DMG96_16670 [Acidobacteria bacterium]|nr:MAG: hypothetical protein DMG96_16670 [Acidobacteriota bacterium]